VAGVRRLSPPSPFHGERPTAETLLRSSCGQGQEALVYARLLKDGDVEWLRSAERSRKQVAEDGA
jgi:hypothetical protein